MTIAAVRRLFWSKQVFLFDLDGTLYLGKKVIPGARELLKKLHSQNKTIFYLTNNSSRSEGDYVKKLSRMGFPVKKNQVVLSTHLLISTLKKKKWRKVFLLGTPAMRAMLKKRGIRHTSRKPAVVVVGFDKTLTYAKLESACRLVDRGCPYIVTHPDLYCPTDQGPEPDCGSFAKVIELVTNQIPSLVLGKPHPGMLEEVMKRGRFSRKQMILVGDRIGTDMEMARRFKVDSILVLTGETKRKDLHALQPRTSNILSSVQELL